MYFFAAGQFESLTAVDLFPESILL